MDCLYHIYGFRQIRPCCIYSSYIYTRPYLHILYHCHQFLLVYISFSLILLIFLLFYSCNFSLCFHTVKTISSPSTLLVGATRFAFATLSKDSRLTHPSSGFRNQTLIAKAFRIFIHVPSLLFLYFRYIHICIFHQIF